MEYFLFKYIWIIAILPKSIQFLIMVSYTVLLTVKARMIRLSLNGISKMFFCVNLIYFFSVIASIYRVNHEMLRIFAAFNTCIITFLAVIIYNFIYKKRLDIYLVGKYMFHNMIILFVIWIAYLILGSYGNFYFMTNVLSSIDWINNSMETRFQAYLEYVNLIVYMVLYCLPFSVIYVNEKYGKYIASAYSVISFFPIISSHSRTGLCCSAVLILTIIITINLPEISNLFVRKKIKCVVVLLGCGIVFGLLFYKQIISGVSYFLTMRQGSTNTRIQLYKDSIQRMINESIIFGCGIKDTWKSIPYGSHSTYIGMYYKTGILGGTIFLLWGIKELFAYLFQKDNLCYSIIIKISLICILGLSFLEDLDGANWNIIMFMAFCAVIRSKDICVEKR